MNLHDYFREGVVAPLGYSPNSSSIKPVHITNGLCRAALGEYYDPKLLNHALIRWAKKGTEERHPTSDLIEDAGDHLGNFAEPGRIGQLNDLRELLKGVLGADKAVFDRNEYCSYTLTHKTHVTRDSNDRDTGDFLYGILAADVGTGESPMLALIRELLNDASDELSVVSLPLIQGVEPREYDPAADAAPDSLTLRRPAQGGGFKSHILRDIRKSFDTLATFERVNGSKLHSLRRLACFSTFSLYLHLTHRGLEYEDGRSYATQRPLMLTDFTSSGWSAVAAASHASYNLASKRIETLIQHGVREVLIREHRERWTGKQIEEFIGEIGLKGTQKKQDHVRAHFLEVFRSYSVGSTNLEALVNAIVDIMLEELSGTPTDFARALGVCGGLLAPRGQRAVKKRYAPSPELLEVLLATCVEPGQELELSELSAIWRERFGIVTDALPGDSADLAKFSIMDATREDLVANANALRDTLIDIGYARRYADGVTIIRLDRSTK